VSVGFYPTRVYHPLVKFGAMWRGGSKSILLKDEHIDALADCLPQMLLSICSGGKGVGYVSGTFRPSPPINFGSGRMYFSTQYISLTTLDL